MLTKKYLLEGTSSVSDSEITHDFMFTRKFWNSNFVNSEEIFRNDRFFLCRQILDEFRLGNKSKLFELNVLIEKWLTGPLCSDVEFLTCKKGTHNPLALALSLRETWCNLPVAQNFDVLSQGNGNVAIGCAESPGWLKSPAAQSLKVLKLRGNEVAEIAAQNPEWLLTPAGQDYKVLSLDGGLVAQEAALHSEWAGSPAAQDLTVVSLSIGQVGYRLCSHQVWRMSDIAMQPEVLKLRRGVILSKLLDHDDYSQKLFNDSNLFATLINAGMLKQLYLSREEETVGAFFSGNHSDDVIHMLGKTDGVNPQLVAIAFQNYFDSVNPFIEDPMVKLKVHSVMWSLAALGIVISEIGEVPYINACYHENELESILDTLLPDQLDALKNVSINSEAFNSLLDKRKTQHAMASSIDSVIPEEKATEASPLDEFDLY